MAWPLMCSSAGVIRRDRRAIAASLLVAFIYGSLAWGVLPIQPGVSWETHLAAALTGVVLAIALRGLDVPPHKRYAWEDEAGRAGRASGRSCRLRRANPLRRRNRETSRAVSRAASAPSMR